MTVVGDVAAQHFALGDVLRRPDTIAGPFVDTRGTRRDGRFVVAVTVGDFVTHHRFDDEDTAEAFAAEQRGVGSHPDAG